LQQAQQIAPELLGIVSHTEMLHPQNAPLIEYRCEEGMVHITLWRFAANTPVLSEKRRR
jgi:hypothetical protein